MNIKKRLSRKALVAVSALGTTLMVASCGDEGKLEEKAIKIGSYSLVDSKNFDYLGDVGNLTVSRDGKNVYVTAGNGRGLFHNDGTDLQKGWTKIKLQTGLDGTLGKAKLETADQVTAISAANDGALVSVSSKRDAPALPNGTSISHGAFYIAGKDKYNAAWSPNLQDMNALAATGAGAATNRLRLNEPITGIVVLDKDKKDVPYFWGEDATPAGGPVARHVAMTKADLTPAIASAKVGRATAFAGKPSIVSGGEYLFAVNELGVTAMPITNVGAAHDFADVGANDGEAGTGLVGSKAFQMKADYQNNAVADVVVSGTNLFIGLGNGNGGFRGGVAVYEIKAAGTPPVVKAPDVEWNNIYVSKLVVDAKGIVWAVTSDDVIEAKVDGKKGRSYFNEPIFDAAVTTFDGAKDGFKRETLPRENLNNAAFVKDKLILSTYKGLLVPTETEKKVRSGKMASTN